MDDAQRARDALDEVHYRRHQVSTLARRRVLPWWSAAGLSVLALGQGVVLDLQAQAPGRGTWYLWYALVMAVVIVLVGIRVRRSVGLQPRGWAARAANVRMWALLGVFLAGTVVVGTVLRALDVPWDQTAGACGGLVVAWAVGLHQRRSDRSGTPRG